MKTTLRTLPRLAAAIALSAAAAGFAASPPSLASPVGLWKTIDDATGQAKSLVRITEHDGVLTGKVEKILTDKVDAKCDECTDERRGKPVLGMTIIAGMKQDGDQWDGGTILDPNNGKVYSSRLRLLDDGRKLDVRGYIGLPLLGRSQTWIREE